MRRNHYIELIWYKGMADLHAEAARAYVGFIWWVLEPLLYMAAFYVAFGMGLRGPGGGVVALSLLCGLVPWKWFASSVQNGSDIIQANSGLIMQVYLPKYVLPGMVMVTNGIKFLIILGLLMLAMAVTHGASPAWLALPVVVLVEMLLALALSTLAAAIVPLLPDLDLVISNGLIVMMFMSGIFSDVDRLPPTLARVLALNPMVHVIRAFRAVLLEKRWPDWMALGGVALFSLVVYGLALALMRRYDRIYPKLLVG
ncbi:MAG TPA: ABC transporter permease [Gammaproteobacteria bacterium]|jgi:lipopolysaccharide transport system permease protein|nr:ABC transporter permease [Gammaproteobacteria bacterium]